MTLPIKYKEVLNLQRLGVKQESIKFTNVTMNSSDTIIVNDNQSLSIVNTSSQAVESLAVKVESAIMNPKTKVLGLRASSGGGSNLQIFNLEMQSRLKLVTLNEPVSFWKWLDAKTVAIVTGTSAYHWSMDGDAEPAKQFSLPAGEVQILNYERSTSNDWLLLRGISRENGAIVGKLTVFQKSTNKMQTIDAHGGCFAPITLNGQSQQSTLLCCTRTDASGTKLLMKEIEGSAGFLKTVPVPLKNPNDFIIAMIPDVKHGMLFALSQTGYLFLFDIESGLCIFNEQVSQTMFLSAPHDSDGGLFALDRSGRLFSFAVDETTIVNHVSKTMNKFNVGVSIAARCNLGGAEEVFKAKFNQAMNAQNYQEAARIAAEAPQGVLRTVETIQAFQNAPIPTGQPYPDLLYFQLLLKSSTLTAEESIGLCQRVIGLNQESGLGHVEKWLTEKKLTPSESLGDLLVQYNMKMACSVYLHGKVPEKTILCFLRMGHWDKVTEYAKKENYTPNYPQLLRSLHQAKREDAQPFAFRLSKEGLLSPDQAMMIFLQPGPGQSPDVESAVGYLLKYLSERGDRDEDAKLQTQLLELSLTGAPQVADAIMDSSEFNFTKYDKMHIARMCEGAGLYKRALEHYDDLEDIKRLLQMAISTNTVNPEFLVKFFGDLMPEDALACLDDLLKYKNVQGNLTLVVEVAKRYNDQLDSNNLVNLFETHEAWSGLYLYLGSFVNFTEDPEIVFKYIQAAVEVKQIQQLELICRENTVYDPMQVKTFLLESAKIKDPRPLIHVCDRHGFVHELTAHLYTNQMFKFIEVYIQKMNPAATPGVVGALLDLNAPEDQIRDLVNTVRPPSCPIGELVAAFEERTRLRLLLPWLEARMHEGREDTDLFNAIGKIYVDINNSPQHFLQTNKFYDSLVVGKYCETRDPHLAYIAYKRGQCDHELISVCNKHGFYKPQSRYLVERADLELWAFALSEDDEHRRALIDQVVATALPETRNPDNVAVAVKAFMNADLPEELIELLDKLVLHGGSDRSFGSYKNLQNLLILTSMKCKQDRVMDYITRLDNYDGSEIAEIAISEQYELYEEGFAIYKKFQMNEDAMRVLLDHIGDLERGLEFAKYCEKPEVWGILGVAQLSREQINDSISSFLKANDASHYEQVIEVAEKCEAWEVLIQYLKMAREHVRQKVVDNELIFAYAKVDDLANIEEFISTTNHSKLDEVGDRCIVSQLFQAGRILFEFIKNYAKLAQCYVYLEMFTEAVEAARKANSITTWKEVCYACVDMQKFRLAASCGVHIIVFMDHLADLISHYENAGHFAELIGLLEQGCNLDRAHQGIYTHLGILYAKYKEQKLMEHINLFWSRLNIPTLLQECKTNLHWKEVVFLYSHYDQFDNAVDTMIEHSPACFDHDTFKSTVVRVSNSEVFYRAISFYIMENPMKLSELLIELSPKLDHKRVVNMVKSYEHLPLIKNYLKHVQRDDIAVVNEALYSLYVEEENFQDLRDSVTEFVQFDQISLAQRLEKHELVEFRRIAATLYQMNGRAAQSIALSKQDRLWKDAMSTAALSGDVAVVEDLLRFFVDDPSIPQSVFGACLFTCYQYIAPDLALELAWRNGLQEFVMPFMIQSFKDLTDKVGALQARMDKKDQESAAADAKAKEAEAQQMSQVAPMLMLTNQPQYGAPNPGFGAPQMNPGMGMGMPQYPQY